MGYIRVLPRDLFNEAKLLKCLGQLSLKAHDGELPGVEVTYDGDPEGFPIEQDRDSGDIYCPSVRVLVRGVELSVSSQLNSRKAYPLVFTNEDGDMCHVFNNDGGISDEFRIFLTKESACEGDS
jgi:hypothetical protein